MGKWPVDFSNIVQEDDCFDEVERVEILTILFTPFSEISNMKMSKYFDLQIDNICLLRRIDQEKKVFRKRWNLKK